VTAGLVLGAPEHDWSGIKNLAFYNNNAWLATGMKRIGAFLMGTNESLAADLLGNASQLAASLQTSLKVCSVFDSNDTLIFVPPYAHKNATPYASMTASHESSYTNFRFWSETMMADIIPSEIESSWLNWHNNHGGRFGGANRFEGWLDDMPTGGWGYGALANNKTDDFLGLLYGHAATYQTPGTFHSTEQLHFTGTGRYRDFMHITDAIPSGPQTSEKHAAENFWDDRQRLATSLAASQRLRHPMYNGIEQDVSFCIVSNILVARMTRWQLVMEDRRADPQTTIWLGKGAPQRWFRSPGGFNVTSAPTSVGRISYQVSLGHATGDTFSIDVSAAKSTALDTHWGVRWPGKLKSLKCSACSIVGRDDANGMAMVQPISGATTFDVTALWSK
jgi:hypothetical protein